MMVVMAVIGGTVVVMRMRSVGVAMCTVVMLDGIAARAATMRPDHGNDAGENGAQQRQEYDCLNHRRLSPSSD